MNNKREYKNISYRNTGKYTKTNYEVGKYTKKKKKSKFEEDYSRTKKQQKQPKQRMKN